jgi:hypothetical protein
MIKRKDNAITLVIAIMVILIALSAGTWVVVSSNQIVAQAITTITAIVGAAAIWFQMRKGKRLNEGEFIAGLNKQFIENRHIYDLFLKMEKYERELAKLKKIHQSNIDKGEKVIEITNLGIKYFSEDDIANVAAYMTFFEVIYSLIQRGIIDLWMIDDLFSYQFFLLLNNQPLQELELIPCEEFYIDVFRLYQFWKEYRLKRNAPILHSENCILDAISIPVNPKKRTITFFKRKSF